MQDEHIVFWAFPIFFLEYWIRQEVSFSHLIKLLIKLKKHLEKPNSKTWALEQNILNKYNCSGMEPSKCQRYIEDWWSNKQLLNQFS